MRNNLKITRRYSKENKIILNNVTKNAAEGATVLAVYDAHCQEEYE